MSILGAIVRTHGERRAALLEQLVGRPGVDVALDPGDGRLILVLEDSAAGSAAASLAAIALMPEVLDVSLVYEHGGDDPEESSGMHATSWRAGLHEMAAGAVGRLDLPRSS
ncbi:MAG: hypothetical protein RL654_1537 [Pseudomonadota bacterium]|jgi:nitrate reductase NapAB chaperone NapD